MTDKQILRELKDKHIDLSVHGLGYGLSLLRASLPLDLIAFLNCSLTSPDPRLTKFIEMREKMGLIRTRKQGHSVESIREVMQRLRKQYPKAGCREAISILFHEEHMLVSR